MTRSAPLIRIGLVGAGTMAGAHSAALTLLGPLYPDLPVRPRLIAVADVNEGLARRLAGRFGYERAERDWRRVVEAADVDLVVACLPPILNREVVLAAAAAGKHVVCEKPLAESAAAAAELLGACRAAGVWTMYFTDAPIRRFRDFARFAMDKNHPVQRAYRGWLLERGIYLHPHYMIRGFLTGAHTEADVDRVVDATAEFLSFHRDTLAAP